MRLTDLPIDRPVATLMLLVSLTVLGGVAVFRIPLSFMPAVEEPEIDVSVPFPGSHPLEALREVAMPIEAELATIPGVRGIRSWISPGQAQVSASFDWSADMDIKQAEVREAIERVRPSLPDGTGFVRVEVDTAGPGAGILEGRISATRDLKESWTLLDERIRRPLERVRGVAAVNLYGVEPQQVRVDLDIEALAAHGIGPDEVIRAIESANLDLDLGTVRGDLLRYSVRQASRFRHESDLADLPLGPPGLRLSDVAHVSVHQPRLNYGRHLDRKFAIGISVSKDAAANTVETVRRLMARIEEIRRDPALEGVTLLVWNNAGDEIVNSISGLRNAGVFGGLLAIVVLFGFLRRWRTTAIVSVAIPFSLIVTCGAMYLLGYEFDVLTMLGLMFGVGMLVDNAVVVMENIHRREAMGMPPPEAARTGVREVFLAVLASTATTVIVWSWLFVTEKSELTIYMGEVAVAICLAVVCSLLISVTFIPLAAARFAPRRPVRPGFLLVRLVPAYRQLLGWTLRHRVVTLAALLGLAGSALVPINRIEKTGEPRFRERDVAITYEIHDPVSKEVLETYVDEVEAWLERRKEELGYESIYSWYSEPGEAATRVYLPLERAQERTIAALRAKLREGLPVIPGVTLNVGERDWWRSRRRERGMIGVALHGDDPEYLERIARRVEPVLRGLAGVREVRGPDVVGQKEIRLRVDPERARNLGVEPAAVADAVGFTFRGRRLRPMPSPSGELELHIGLPEEEKPGLAVLNALRIPRSRGEPIPLTSVAEVTIARVPPRIQREERMTTYWIGVRFDEETTTEEARGRIRSAMTAVPLPPGYSWDFGRMGRQRDETLAQMAQGVGISLLVVLLLMAALFESFSQPLAILITLPLAFFGAFWLLWLAGYILDSVAFMGVIILIGIVVNNGIVLVDHVNSLRRAGMSRTDALVSGCGDRLRPVLMTATTTIFGLMPLVFSGFTVANAYVDSLAVAVIGGLATSTLFTLVALPVWYTTVEDVAALMLRLLPRPVEPEAGLPHPGVLAAGD